MNNSYRINTKISSDAVLNVNMRQDFDFLEVLSLKLRQRDAYRLHSSNYGVIVGRVLANDAFGIPNAKVSVFIERDGNDSSDVEAFYPYTEVNTRDKEGRRYNLLPDYSDDDCYRVVGTFPNKRLMLDDDIQLEIFDKYWKYTTVTNQAGDYMLFAVPTGSTSLHVDIDLSDIGVLSQKPRDFEYKGYNLSMFDSPSQFKESTNLDNLAQLFSQNKSVFVYPFWGDKDNGVAAITRSDIQIQYKFEPTCVFMGSIVSDNDGHSIGHKCAPNVENGMNNQLIGGSGTIEMIRKTTDGLIEEYQIRGNQLIDDDGVWCYQIPMNLDYVGTDEYGNTVPTDNPNKGIPTRAQVRFRISKNETQDEGFSRHTAKYLVPMNPIFAEDSVIPKVKMEGSEVERMYEFGSSTPEHCFRDLYWNNVYSVKNYIPKAQVAHRPYSKNYTALKGANLADSQNPIPFNKLRIDMPFSYVMICTIVTLVTYILTVLNTLLCVVYSVINAINKLIKIIKKIPFVGKIIPSLDWLLDMVRCLSLTAGITEGNIAYYPGCWCHGWGDCPGDDEDEQGNNDCEKSNDPDSYLDRVQRNLAEDYKIIKLDFYQDWINGVLYMPLWYWRKRKKKTFLFGLFSSKAKSEFCSCENSGYSRLKTYTSCELPYSDTSLEIDSNINDDQRKWHKTVAYQVRYRRGLINPKVNRDDLTVYYYAAIQATSDNNNPKQALSDRPSNFYGVRLYATDIILLGNLLEENLYGIPQFFKCLPPTTTNIPPIAVIKEALGDETDETTDNDTIHDSNSDSEDNGMTITTGMDWARRKAAKKDSPQFKDGLFMDLSCTYADTNPKSCVNVERLSELGVNLDASYTMRYAQGGNDKIKSGTIEADGFITKLELDDFENRAMFATLNHIGFIPQTYQQTVSAYTTQVEDENTSYLIPKFKYLYPVDFDGRQQNSMTKYINGFEQPMYDEKDESYLTFRLGAEEGNNIASNSERRIRHFYKTPSNSSDKNYHMPLYNNSYYFYFGIKKGGTAIDKFNKIFYAECYKNDKKPFTAIIDKKGRSYCPSIGGYGYIRVNADDIKQPFAYSLVDDNGTEIISEENMTERDFVIGGKFDGSTSKPIPNDDGKIRYQIDSGKTVDIAPYDENGLINQLYHLTLTDADGKSITENVELEVPILDIDYNVTPLGAKFYSTTATRIDYICNKDNDYYGKVEIDGFSVDGYDCTIDSITFDGYSSGTTTYNFILNGHSDTFNGVNAYLSITSMEIETKDCMCDSDNSISSVQSADTNSMINAYVIGDVNDGGKNLTLNVYQPTKFMLSLTQKCDGKVILDNAANIIVNVGNGENFNTYLNTMPLNFMLGTINDNIYASTANKSYFYRTSAVTSPTDNGVKGWYGVHQEDAYQFGLPQNQVKDANSTLWEDYISLTSDLHTHEMKAKVLKFKFDAMFGLSNGVYVTNDSEGRLEMTAKGGKAPRLIRTISPYYANTEKLLKPKEAYLFQDMSMVTYLTDYPNIVGFNASGYSKSSRATDINPQWNGNYQNKEHVGNYFAAFTNNGGYVTKNDIDSKKSIMRQPSYASVTPTSKELGADKEVRLNDAKDVYQSNNRNKTNPWLRALNVDRRFDYNFIFMGPIANSGYKLYDDDAKNRTWRSVRLSGTTYNGIEMSYDDEYNIISATTTDSGATFVNNGRLEYTYQYSDGNGDNEAVTKYNHSNDCVWSASRIGYCESADTTDKQLIKAPYSNTINGVDLCNFYWSSFNKNRLLKYVTNGCNNSQIGGKGLSGLTNADNPFYVFGYPSNDATLYNGDFNMDDVINGNSYPTVRYIDICNLTPLTTYAYSNVACSYNMTSSINEGEIKATVNGKEETEFVMNFDSPIEFVTLEEEDAEYAHVTFGTDGNVDVCGTWKKFEANDTKLTFTYKTVEANDFNVFTSVPRLIRVTPNPSGDTDAITMIKTVNQGNEFGGKYGDGMTLDKAIDTATITPFNVTRNRFPFTKKNVELPSDVSIYSDYHTTLGDKVNGDFFRKNNLPLPSNSEDFGNIKFFIHGSYLKNVDSFAVLTTREYENTEEDGLTKHIKTVEFSDIYSIGDFELRVLFYGPRFTNDYDTCVSANTVLSYVDSEEKQVLTIEMKQSGIFGDVETMDYSFDFIDNEENTYTVIPTAENYCDYDGVVRFTLVWDKNMENLLNKDKWGDQIPCIIHAVSANNFIYKVNFTIEIR